MANCLASAGNLTAASGKGKKKGEPHAGTEKEGNLAAVVGDVREGDCFGMQTCKANIQGDVRTYIHDVRHTYVHPLSKFSRPIPSLLDQKEFKE